MSGEENMRIDADTLAAVESGDVPPTLRLFSFRRPTVSFGRLQHAEGVRPFVPAGWENVQRPTGGGIVFHEQDLCFSLAWRQGDPPLPSDIKDVYPWIHTVVREALAPWLSLALATCRDGRAPAAPFPVRQCFEAPVAYDLLEGKEKIVGGALAKRRRSFLYQGTIHEQLPEEALQALENAFRQRFDA